VNTGTLIIGGSAAGLQAALDLADSGTPVHLAISSPFLCNHAAPNITPQKMNARSLEVLNHPLVTTWTNTEILDLEKDAAGFRANLRQKPRYVDLARCVACGDCLEVCPVSVPGTSRKAIFLDGQPGCMAIDKPGKAPCSGTCPGGIHVQGYVALIAQRRYQEAIELIREALPFPSVCGRVCNHYCETNCTRGKVDAPLNIMALKRFVADWAYENRAAFAAPQRNIPEATGKKIAIIGAGPSGLTAARDLVRLGHAAMVFDALPTAGGMMKVGIPPHRLPSEQLDWEIQQIVDEGVELVLNTRVDDIPGLIEAGFDATLIATGAHRAKKISLRNSNHPDNWLSLDLLRRVRLGEHVDLSDKKVLVLGGGNVALDTVRTAVRLGAAQVRMACLEPRGEMPGFDWEVGVAEEEGVEMYPGRTFKEVVVEQEKIIGVRCAEVDFRGFQGGRPDFDEIPGSGHILPADLVIWAIGQEPDFSFLPHDGSIDTRFPFGIRSDENMMTTSPGVFVAGDVHRGQTFFVIDAIGEGHKAARCIDRYLRGDLGIPEPVPVSRVEYSQKESQIRFDQSNASGRIRTQIPNIPLKERHGNFREVDLSLSEEDAITEASRCLLCGPCSECLACIDVCQAGAIDHYQQEKNHSMQFSAVIYADHEDGFSDLSIVEGPGCYRLTPEDALEGSAAAAHAMRDSRANQQSLPISPALEIRAAPARIGLFACQCGDNKDTGRISSIVDTQALCELASTQTDVVYARTLPYACSPVAAQAIHTAVDAHALDRVVLAACSCCNIDQVCFSCTYQRLRSKGNLGLFNRTENNLPGSRRNSKMSQYELVNIREQCAWVHANDPQTATVKASSMVAAAIARARAAPAKLAGGRAIDRSTLILGNGAAASFCKDTLDPLGVNAERVDAIPTKILRSDGEYVVHLNEQAWSASSLVLIPANREEAENLLAAFGRPRRRPQRQAAWGGLNTHRPGVFYVSSDIDPSMAGSAVAARVRAWMGRTECRPPTAAVVDPDRCRACETCIETCEYCAPELIKVNDRYTSWIDPAICVSCGTCAAHCPSGAINAGCSTDAQLEAMLDAILT
jgi:NADPH-dependent glutamate synthase beta subunit-like oxidoreductase/Pyruvate/2-oxoacid:ferredoxin oxidoreductase delta subunit